MLFAPLILMLSCGQIYPLKKCVWVKLKNFFYCKRERERERERESEFTRVNGCSLAVLSLMGIILPFLRGMCQGENLGLKK
jgi:hypothetical protein